MEARKIWTQQQAQLRKALASRANFQEALELFLAQHAAVHSAEISGGQVWSLHDEVLTGLPAPLIKTVPARGQNSIAWLLWHITRIEDMTMNRLTLRQPQVWDKAWAEQLGLASPDCGASMNEEDVAGVSAQINAGAVLEYRAAVGRRTRESILNLDADQARETVPTALVQELVDEGSISTRAGWLFEYYCQRTRAFFMTRTATSHNFIHLNEAGRTRDRLLKNNLRK